MNLWQNQSAWKNRVGSSEGRRFRSGPPFSSLRLRLRGAAYLTPDRIDKGLENRLPKSTIFSRLAFAYFLHQMLRLSGVIVEPAISGDQLINKLSRVVDTLFCKLVTKDMRLYPNLLMTSTTEPFYYFPQKEHPCVKCFKCKNDTGI